MTHGFLIEKIIKVLLFFSVDLFFQRLKPDTVIHVTSDGKITWFVPSIFTTGCPIRVKWFPYDIQVCDMTFGSFAYTGKELILIPDSSIDAVQNR